MTEAEFIEKHGIDCLNCDNSGVIAVQVKHDEWEPEQCEFCYSEPHSKFNVASDLSALIEQEKRKAAIGFAEYFLEPCEQPYAEEWYDEYLKQQ